MRENIRSWTTVSGTRRSHEKNWSTPTFTRAPRRRTDSTSSSRSPAIPHPPRACADCDKEPAKHWSSSNKPLQRAGARVARAGR